MDSLSQPGWEHPGSAAQAAASKIVPVSPFPFTVSVYAASPPSAAPALWPGHPQSHLPCRPSIPRLKELWPRDSGLDGRSHAARVTSCKPFQTRSQQCPWWAAPGPHSALPLGAKPCPHLLPASHRKPRCSPSLPWVPRCKFTWQGKHH